MQRSTSVITRERASVSNNNKNSKAKKKKKRRPCKRNNKNNQMISVIFIASPSAPQAATEWPQPTTTTRDTPPDLAFDRVFVVVVLRLYPSHAIEAPLLSSALLPGTAPPSLECKFSRKTRVANLILRFQWIIKCRVETQRRRRRLGQVEGDTGGHGQRRSSKQLNERHTPICIWTPTFFIVW